MRNYIEEYVFDFETALLNDDLTSSTRTYTDYIDWLPSPMGLS